MKYIYIYIHAYIYLLYTYAVNGLYKPTNITILGHVAIFKKKNWRWLQSTKPGCSLRRTPVAPRASAFSQRVNQISMAQRGYDYGINMDK